jgi:poly(3-hydroxybutyrate) depolymerase
MKIASSILTVEFNAAIADEDFINQVLTETLADKSLPEKNIYVFGISMGGYMAYQYAVKYGTRLNGLLDLTGTMGAAIEGKASAPALPVCIFHSVDDNVVPYTGTSSISIPFIGAQPITFGEPIENVRDFWVTTNSAGSAQTYSYPQANGINVTKYTYPQGKKVWFYKAAGAAAVHTYFFSHAGGDAMDYMEEAAAFINHTASSTITDIADVEAHRPLPAAYYTIFGQRLNKAPESGFYIIIYDNGEAEKILR